MNHSFIALYFLRCHLSMHITVNLFSLFSHVYDSQSVICQYCGSGEWGFSYTDTNIDLAPLWAALSRGRTMWNVEVLNIITYTVTEVCITVGL